MDSSGLKEIIELAKLRMKSKKEYETVMANLFSVHTDFMVFERELDKVYQDFEKKWAAESK